MDLENHSLAGRYDVLKRIQSGYYGTTWLAKDRLAPPDACCVCIKTFFSENPSQRRELAVLKQLCERNFHHDNVCAVLDVSLDKAPVIGPSGHQVTSLQYVVFEYCSGSDLFNFLCTGPFERLGRCDSFPEPLARHYITQCVLGLMYLHERGVYHRDIKPENCVLDANWDLKLTDFGTNKIVPSEDLPHLLRTKTGGIGTESYRAPEVNSGKAYDPAAADVWSLGVTLFFFVAIEMMVTRAASLDQYTRKCLAPLGIFFPFPYHCSKLDSYLRREEELRVSGVTGNMAAQTLRNDKFWNEWKSVKDALSPDLIDLLNRMFLLVPSLRITLRDLVRHPWVSRGERMTPKEISRAMRERCPSSVTVQQGANPRVTAGKLLGGVDQAVLRESLSRSGKQPEEFPEDSELWAWSPNLQHLESIQLMMIGLDIQELMTDLNFIKEVLRSVLSQPYREDNRSVPYDYIHTEWISQLLLVIGYLPQGYSFYLNEENMNLQLMRYTVDVLEGVELAVTRSVIATSSDENGDSDEQEDETMMDVEGVDSGGGGGGGGRGGRGINGDSRPTESMGEEAVGERMVQQGVVVSAPVPMTAGSYLSGDDINMTPDTPIGSSQESTWTQYTMSTQSSQEELPESLQLSHDWTASFADKHQLLELGARVNVQLPSQYKAAAEFCKMSGLLCCYGLYQVVCHDQLALYCRGNTASFSVRVVHVPTEDPTRSLMCLSSWCLSSGVEEWALILDRLRRDMNGHQQ